MLAAVLDCYFGSGSGSQRHYCQIGGLGCQYTRTVNSGLVQCKSPNPSELVGLSVGRPAGQSVDLYNVVVFAVEKVYIFKIRYPTANNLFLHVSQSATLIILGYLFFLLYVALLAIEAVKCSVMSSIIRRKPWLHNIQDQILWTLRWRSVAWRGNVCILHCFKWTGCHDIVSGLIPHCDT